VEVVAGAAAGGTGEPPANSEGRSIHFLISYGGTRVEPAPIFIFSVALLIAMAGTLPDLKSGEASHSS
jgi:hypothetical protein